MNEKNTRSSKFLTEHMQKILVFYYPNCMDTERGGFFNQFKDDGFICDRRNKCLVRTPIFVQ